ncbi:unnamed protein product [Caenorhabditis angaria]|uniref:Saposin B-type domain-containing protein n=1 Tax=Caenorhabditis angaria TaxID=860376 RepID=A0A9P1J0V3_9PELO|nr:unnamed protein product [Caenorhabditis angaria]
MFKCIVLLLFCAVFLVESTQTLTEANEKNFEENNDEDGFIMNNFGFLMSNSFPFVRKILIKLVKTNLKKQNVNKMARTIFSFVKKEKIISCVYKQIESMTSECLAEEDWLECSIIRLQKNCGKIVETVIMKFAQEIILE